METIVDPIPPFCCYNYPVRQIAFSIAPCVLRPSKVLCFLPSWQLGGSNCLPGSDWGQILYLYSAIFSGGALAYWELYLRWLPQSCSISQESIWALAESPGSALAISAIVALNMHDKKSAGFYTLSRYIDWKNGFLVHMNSRVLVCYNLSSVCDDSELPSAVILLT
jgi:hypothetical protein